MSQPARRDAVRAAVAAAGADALLVAAPVNVRYLTGFAGSVGALLVAADAAGDRLAVDGRYADQAAAQAPDLPLVVTRERAWLAEAVPAGATLALEGARLPWSEARAIAALLEGRRVVPLDGVVEAVRVVKDDAEVAALARACAITGEALLDLLDHVRPGRTEREIATHLERAMVDRGAEDRAFPSIVAAGPNGGRPHHRPSDRPLAEGDVVTIDAGARVDGYHADMTRVLVLGTPPPVLDDVLTTVAAAHGAGLQAARAGITADALDAACRDVVAAAGLADRFVHGTGHGVGLEIHEPPLLAAGATATLRSRMAVTVEPGVYLPDIGGARIEDTVLLRPDGADILTAIPSDVFLL